MSLEVMIPRRVAFSMTGRCLMSLLAISWIASWMSFCGSMDVTGVVMIRLTLVFFALSPFATTFLAISCSEMIPTTEVPLTIIRELIFL